jgi:hypothetical protein
LLQKKRWQRLFAACTILPLCFLLAACSASNSQKAASTSNQAQVADRQEAAVSGDAAPASAQPEQNAVANPSTPASGITASPVVAARKMIYKADVKVEIENYAKARSAITSLVTRYQGYILSSSDYESENEKGGSMVVRIPQAGFSSFLDELDKLATKIPDRSIQGQDVTEEYVDLSSRLKARQAVEARLLQFMAEAKKTEDLLKISADLAKVQEEIEQIKGRMRYLDENVSYSTISIMLVEKKVTATIDDVTDASTWEQAWLTFHQSLLAILAFLKWLVVVIAGTIPVLLFLAVPGVPVFLYLRRKRKSKPTPPPASID